jgi:hypothetical protein
MGLICRREEYPTTLFEINNSLDDFNVNVSLSGVTISNIKTDTMDLSQDGTTMICLLDGSPDVSFLNENDVVNMIISYYKQNGIKVLSYKSVGKQKIIKV